MKNKKRLVAALVILAVLVISSGLFAYFNATKSSSNDQKPPVEIADQTIDMNPATEQEKADTEKYKESLSNPDQDNLPTGDDGKKEVVPVIGSVAQQGASVNLSAFVGTIVEDGGTCTAEFSNAAGAAPSFTKQVSAVADARSTVCAPINVDVSDFKAKGDWNVKVTYNSSTSKGESPRSSFKVN